MFENDGLTCIFILGLILLVSLHAWPQETCKHCDISSLDAQFPEGPQTHHRVFTKPFITAELTHAIAISLDSYETVSKEGHNCVEGHNGFPEIEHGPELALDGAIEFSAGFIFTALLKRSAPKHLGWTPFLIPAYGTALHAHGAAQWYAHC